MKSSLRRQLLGDRQAMHPDVCHQKSQAICDRLEQYLQFRTAQTVLAYFSFRQEPDLSDLWRRYPAKTWGFPRCEGRQLIWHQVIWHQVIRHEVVPTQLSQQTSVGKFGMLEPRDTLPLIDTAAIDLVLVPALACDRRGYRLGYGAGFYDRFLAGGSYGTVGVIYAQDLLSELPADPWDVPLKCICTDTDFLEF